MNIPQSTYVYGKNSVKALLSHQPKRVFKLWIQQDQKPDKRITAIYDLAKQHGIPVLPVPVQKLNDLLRDFLRDQADLQPSGASDLMQQDIAHQGITHQGVVAAVAAKPLLSLEELLTLTAENTAQYSAHKVLKPPFLLMLDGIEDPRNVGAILRVADGAGLSGLILAKRHSSFGPAVAKTASGAEVSVPVASVGNLAQALEQLKKAGFWVVCTAMTPNAQPYTRLDVNMPMVLILGNEEKGVSTLLQKLSDFQVTIPMHGVIESLNVATAAAVLAFDFRARQKDLL